MLSDTWSVFGGMSYTYADEKLKIIDNEIRDQRYILAKEEATNFDAIRLLDQLQERPIIDGFQSEKDLIYAEEIEPKLRKQILSKCENNYNKPGAYNDSKLINSYKTAKCLNLSRA